MAFGENQDFGVNFKSITPTTDQTDGKFGVKIDNGAQPVVDNFSAKFPNSVKRLALNDPAYRSETQTYDQQATTEISNQIETVEKPALSELQNNIIISNLDNVFHSNMTIDASKLDQPANFKDSNDPNKIIYDGLAKFMGGTLILNRAIIKANNEYINNGGTINYTAIVESSKKEKKEYLATQGAGLENNNNTTA